MDRFLISDRTPQEGEAIELAADQYACWRQQVPDDIPNWAIGPYRASMENARLFMPLALAALTEPRTVSCDTCGGTDEQLSDGTYSENGCPACTDGTRTLPPLLRWNDDATLPCETCGGTGEVIEGTTRPERVACIKCGGTGTRTLPPLLRWNEDT